jgi:hypothetical protein
MDSPDDEPNWKTGARQFLDLVHLAKIYHKGPTWAPLGLVRSARVARSKDSLVDFATGTLKLVPSSSRP